MSERDLVRELKENIKELTQDRDDALAKVKTKEVPAHGSVLPELGSTSSPSGPRSEVPSPDPWELDTHTHAHTRMGPNGIAGRARIADR